MNNKDRHEKYVNGQYQCIKKLGSGGFGEVWSCIDLLAASKSPSAPEFFTFAMKIEHLQDAEPGKDEEGPKVPAKKVPVPPS
jgi:serine/threonine protein kinase